jgi:hypothetical protein
MLAAGLIGVQVMDKFKLQFGLIAPSEIESTAEVGAYFVYLLERF